MLTHFPAFYILQFEEEEKKEVQAMISFSISARSFLE
jgi:hypothetical protein